MSAGIIGVAGCFKQSFTDSSKLSDKLSKMHFTHSNQYVEAGWSVVEGYRGLYCEFGAIQCHVKTCLKKKTKALKTSGIAGEYSC